MILVPIKSEWVCRRSKYKASGRDSSLHPQPYEPNGPPTAECVNLLNPLLTSDSMELLYLDSTSDATYFLE